MSVSKSDKGDDISHKMANDNSPAFASDHCTTNPLPLISGSANANEILSGSSSTLLCHSHEIRMK